MSVVNISLSSCFDPDFRPELTGQLGKRILGDDATLSVLRLSTEPCLELQRHQKVSLVLINCYSDLCYIQF